MPEENINTNQNEILETNEASEAQAPEAEEPEEAVDTAGAEQTIQSTILSGVLGYVNFDGGVSDNTTSGAMVSAERRRLFRRDVYVGLRDTEQNIEFLAADNQLTQLATATGGQPFFPRFDTEYPLIYETISHQLRNQYNIAFIPSNQKKDGKLHKLRIEVEDLDVNKDGKPDGLKAHSRQGYYAPKS